MTRPRLAVIGGGITGLAAAWEAAGDDSWAVTLLESSGRLGGKIRTSEFAGRSVDEGADAFLRRVPEALELCEELGLDDLTSPALANARTWIDGELIPIPPGHVLGVPIDLDAIAPTGVLSPEGLARARQEEATDSAAVRGDTSLGLLLRDRFGDEVVDRLVEPLIGGIYAGVLDEMSLDAAAPQIAPAAHRPGPISRNLAAARAADPPPAGAVFAAPVGGMGQLIDALSDGIERRGARTLLDAPVAAIRIEDGQYVVDRTDGSADSFEAVVVATPAAPAARLVNEMSPAAAALLDTIASSSVVLVTLAFDERAVGGSLDSSGFLVPRTAPDVRITAASWFTSKWAHLDEGDGQVILRVSLGHAGDSTAIDLSDEEIVATVAADLATTMGIVSPPSEVRISRWRDGFAQYGVGHHDLVERIEAALTLDAPRVICAGAAFRGIGIPACIRQGRLAARQVMGS
jgi:oxygen-dependent protoporphyrinogen oxidase